MQMTSLAMHLDQAISLPFSEVFGRDSTHAKRQTSAAT